MQWSFMECTGSFKSDVSFHSITIMHFFQSPGPLCRPLYPYARSFYITLSQTLHQDQQKMVAFTLRSFASPLTVFLRITVLPRAIVLSSNSSGIGITCPKALKLLPNSHRASMQQVTQQVTQRKKIQP